MKIWNLPAVEFIQFDELEEQLPVILVTTSGAWEAVYEDLKHLNIATQIEVSEATVHHWNTKIRSFMQWGVVWR